MANPRNQVEENVAGEFFVDASCIDCDACRQIAPSIFGDGAGHSFVRRQPRSALDKRQAFHALLSCPTGSIGNCGHDDPKSTLNDFPLTVEEPVYFCGFNSPKSYGGNSYFIRQESGNWLVDSPKFLPPLVRKFEEHGGVANIFLTHADDVADADKFADHFGSRRIIHRAELSSQPQAEEVLEGDKPIALTDGMTAIPTPGHTEGHMVLLLHQRFLFSGDHLAWSQHGKRLVAFHDYCWHSWRQQTDSMERLADFRFEWVLPGHGQMVHLSAQEVRDHLQRLIRSMRERRDPEHASPSTNAQSSA